MALLAFVFLAGCAALAIFRSRIAACAIWLPGVGAASLLIAQSGASFGIWAGCGVFLCAVALMALFIRRGGRYRQR
jgi:hypothetical protein